MVVRDPNSPGWLKIELGSPRPPPGWPAPPVGSRKFWKTVVGPGLGVPLGPVLGSGSGFSTPCGGGPVGLGGEPVLVVLLVSWVLPEGLVEVVPVVVVEPDLLPL